MAEIGEEGDRRKKKRKRREKERIDDSKGQERLDGPSASAAAAGGAAMDPLLVLGSDVLMRILEFLDARSVARLLVVSRGWYEVAISDRIWAPKCEELLKGKAHIPRLLKVRGASKLAAYSMSVMDGKRPYDSWCHLCGAHSVPALPLPWGC